MRRIDLDERWVLGQFDLHEHLARMMGCQPPETTLAYYLRSLNAPPPVAINSQDQKQEKSDGR